MIQRLLYPAINKARSECNVGFVLSRSRDSFLELLPLEFLLRNINFFITVLIA